MLHSYSPGQVGREQIAILREEHVDLRNVKLDHSVDTMDVEYLLWIAEQGCYLGMDRIPGLHFKNEVFPSPDARTRTIKAVIDAGFADRILLSHDTFLVSSFFDTLPDPVKRQNDIDNPYKLLYLHKAIVPKLLELGVSQGTIDSIFSDNPRSFFEGA
jgi:phosphotriesterase-related protein